jgi:hypothetical protein
LEVKVTTKEINNCIDKFLACITQELKDYKDAFKDSPAHLLQADLDYDTKRQTINRLAVYLQFAAMKSELRCDE